MENFKARGRSHIKEGVLGACLAVKAGLLGLSIKQGALKVFVRTLLFFSKFLESSLDKIYIICYYKKRKNGFCD